jgi:hypothetical protein
MKIFNIQKFKKLFTKLEVSTLKNFYGKKYKTDYHSMSDINFLNWLFDDNDIYIKNVFILYKNGLDPENIYTANNQQYINIKLYEDKESNLDLFELSLDKYSISFNNKIDMLLFYKKLTIKKEITTELLNTLELEFKLSNIGIDEWIEEFIFETTDCFYENFKKDGKEFCKGAIIKNNNFFNTYSIYLYGNDDYSISKDFYTEKEAMLEWENLKNKKTIRKNDLTNHYFSN